MVVETGFLLLLMSSVGSSRAKTQQRHDKETSTFKQDKLSALACFSSVLENGMWQVALDVKLMGKDCLSYKCFHKLLLQLDKFVQFCMTLCGSAM